jgi:hypothetical protein
MFEIVAWFVGIVGGFALLVSAALVLIDGGH